MDASHPEIYLSYTAMIPAALRRLWGMPGSNPELLRSSLVEHSCLNQLSHHNPKNTWFNMYVHCTVYRDFLRSTFCGSTEWSYGLLKSIILQMVCYFNLILKEYRHKGVEVAVVDTV
jgi:hypothetical protein